jgi:glutathione synthase/RimK-type ligase-like ATP-grasp enzyme
VVLPSELPWMAEEDRGYAAAEMSAFLLAWVDALGGVHEQDGAGRAAARGTPGHLRPPSEIVLWGVQDDPPISEVYRALIRLGAAPRLIGPADLVGARIEETASGRVLARSDGLQLPLADIRAIYTRPERLDSQVEIDLMAWTEEANVTVINRPSASIGNASKASQIRAIERAGLRVPATLVTTEPESVRAFQASHGRVVFKSISGVRSIVTELTSESELRLDRVTHCPTMFQEYVQGVDVRVHVVGDVLFAAEVSSEAIDYRYGDVPPRVQKTQLPEELATAVRAMVAGMGLLLAGVDLRRTPEGEWVCFEVNPSPAFTYYCQWTNDPVADGIGRLLMRN